MRPDQLGDFRRPSDPRLAPNGVDIAFVVTQLDLDADRYVSRIWLWDGSQARPLTSGPGDTSPRWSPDGSQLAFLRKGDVPGSRPQIAVLPMTGGEARTVSDFPLGASEFAWSPDGARLAAIATSWVDELADLDDDERTRRPRRIVRLPFRFDSMGWRHDRRRHLYLVDPDGDGDEPVCLTPGDFDEFGIAWHPNGSEIAFISARHDGRGLDAGCQVWAVSSEGGPATARTDVGLWSHLSYDTAGELYAIGVGDPWNMVTVRRLHRLSAPGDEMPLYQDLDRNLETFSPPLSPGGPQWLTDGTALSTLEDSGRVRVIRLLADGSTVDVIGGDRLVTGIDPRPDGHAFAFTSTSTTDPGELWCWEDGSERRLTDLNGEFRAAVPLIEPERFEFESEGVTIEGWAYLPAEGESVPLLLNIHGGPATQYGYGFFDEFQVYATAGYGVVAINPRGSSGYGADHVAAVAGRWEEDFPPDMADFTGAIAAALERFSVLDANRLGVMGGSYGGLSTVRLLALDQRFRSAVAERGLYSWTSFHGTSDIGPWFTRMYLGDDVGGDPEKVWASSPLAYSGSITTPTLIIHSESDYRTPVEQAEQLFVRLLQSDVTTEFLRFPEGEGHELSRSGTPKHRVERFEAILEWHGRHLV
jgi:dipeptidyl aminopeptidase/acylaminoacyl peptidase